MRSVRYLYPLLAVLAFLLFLASLLAGLVAVLLVPVVVGLLAAALAAAGQFVLLLRLLGSLLRLTFGAIGRAGTLVADLFRAFFGGDPEPTGVAGTYGREALPELFRVVDEVAAAAGTRPVDRIMVTWSATAAVFDVRPAGVLPRRRRRVLVLGLPVTYTMTLDELRAVLGHELGHFALGHLWLRRATERLIDRAIGQLLRMEQAGWYVLDPVYWGVRGAVAIMAANYHPWRRLREYEADWVAALATGSNHATSMLRKLRDQLPAVARSQDLVAEWCLRNGAAPRHLGEAAVRVSWALPPQRKKALAVALEGDPFDLEGQTHPPVALRIAALHGLPSLPPRHAELAVRYLPDLRNMEEHLTKVALRRAEVSPTAPLAAQVLAELMPPPGAEDGARA